MRFCRHSWLLGALALGAIVALALPSRTLPSETAPFVGIVVAVALEAVFELRWVNTAFGVRRPTTGIVTTDPFSLTRNPVYLSILLLYIGIAFLINSPWMLLIAIPTGSALCLTAIRPEERYLAAKFGDTYRHYADSVSRWMSWRSFRPRHR